MEPLSKRSLKPEVEGDAKRKKNDPASARIVSLALDRFVANGILTDEQRSSFAARLMIQEREQWYSETLSSIAKMLHTLSLGKLKIIKSALPERISEERFDTFKREIIFEYGWHIRIMLGDCAEANLDEFEVVEMADKEPLLPACVKQRGPERSTTLPKLLTPLHLFFQQRKWLLIEY
ncbi:MAG: hypothetical protein LLG04_18705, partial [Parachlamydia sp.]|nr:hypothetical protein [Parachlamydia sp.]